MIKNYDKIKDLEDYLKGIKKEIRKESKKGIERDNKKYDELNEISTRICVLIDYYKGVRGKESADKYKISVRSINRWVNRYESGGTTNIGRSDVHKEKLCKIKDMQMKKIENKLKKNPLEIGLGYSIWNTTLLKKYIKDKFSIEVSKIYCSKLLNKSDTIYKSIEYDVKKNEKLAKVTKGLIDRYEADNNYNVWYFGTYYLGRDIITKINLENKVKTESEKLEEMLMGNEVNRYLKYILYAFYYISKEEKLEYSVETNVNKKIFVNLLKEFIKDKEKKIKEGAKILIVLPSNNVFKTIIDEEKIFDTSQVKILFIPKNLQNINKINVLFNNIKKDKFNVKGKNKKKIEKLIGEILL